MATTSENLFGTEGQSRAFSRFGPQHQQQNDTLIRDLLSRLGSQTTQGFEPIENQARRDFQQKTLPTIAERFTSLGNNAVSSPAYQSQQYGSAVDLDTNLAALKAQYGMQNNSQMMELLQLLSPNQAYFPGQPGALEGVARGAAEGLPNYLAAQGMGNDSQGQQQGQDGGGFDWQDAIANLLLSLAPSGVAFGPIGAAAGAGAAAIGGGLKYFNKKKGNSQPQNFNAQSTPIQKQLMNLGQNQNSQYSDLSFKGPGGQGSPLGQIDFSQRSPGLNRIGALA